jgi:RimJ/RimL family protein N-acetyltransferase
MTEPWDTMPTFAVVLDDHVIGTVNLEIDPVKRTAMLGYALARAHWGRGFATEAATAVRRAVRRWDRRDGWVPERRLRSGGECVG